MLFRIPVLAFATSAGAFVVEETPGSEASSSTKSFTTDSINSVDFSSSASFLSGFLYTTTTEFLRTYNLSTDALSGTHSVEEATRGQTLITGTISIVRTTDVA